MAVKSRHRRDGRKANDDFDGIQHKCHIIEQVCRSHHVPYKLATSIVNEFLLCVINALSEHKMVQIRGFGKFIPRYRNPKRVGNFGHGKMILPAHHSVGFRAAPYVKAKMNQPYGQFSPDQHYRINRHRRRPDDLPD